MKIKRLMAGLLCGAVGAATLGLSGCGNAADSGMMDAANANAVAGGSSDLPVITWKMGSTWGDGNIHFTCDERFSELVSQLTDGRFTIRRDRFVRQTSCSITSRTAPSSAAVTGAATGAARIPLLSCSPLQWITSPAWTTTSGSPRAAA